MEIGGDGRRGALAGSPGLKRGEILLGFFVWALSCVSVASAWWVGQVGRGWFGHEIEHGLGPVRLL